MATSITPQKATSAPQLRLTVTDQGLKNPDTSWFTVKLEYVSTSKPSTNKNREWRIYLIDGGSSTIIESGTFDIDQVGTIELSSFTHIVTKTTSTRNIQFFCHIDWDLTWSRIFARVRQKTN